MSEEDRTTIKMLDLLSDHIHKQLSNQRENIDAIDGQMVHLLADIKLKVLENARKGKRETDEM